MAAFHLLSSGYGGERVASTVPLVVSADRLVVIDPDNGRLQIRHPRPHPYPRALARGGHRRGRLPVPRSEGARPLGHLPSGPLGGGRRRATGSPTTSCCGTPGHTAQDITTIVRDGPEVIAFTHLWWYRTAPYDDPPATDAEALNFKASWTRVRGEATLIVPGHGEPFVPDDTNSRQP